MEAGDGSGTPAKSAKPGGWLDGHASWGLMDGESTSCILYWRRRNRLLLGEEAFEEVGHCLMRDWDDPPELGIREGRGEVRRGVVVVVLSRW